MGWAAIFQAIAKTFVNAFTTWSYLNETKEQSKEIAQQSQQKADERAKKAKYDMQRQKTSFLKGGVYFDSGTPLEVINETYDTMKEDIASINRDSLTAQEKLRRAGKTAFFTFAIDPAGDNGQSGSNIYQSFASNNNNSTFNSTATKTSATKTAKVGK